MFKTIETYDNEIRVCFVDLCEQETKKASLRTHNVDLHRALLKKQHIMSVSFNITFKNIPMKK